MTDKIFDVLGIGCCTVDDLLYLENFPAPDSKHRVLERIRDGGGLTASALVAASRLGARCSYAALLGHDELSRFVADNLRRENIDLSHIVWSDNAQPIHSTILVDTTHNTRTILWSKNGETGAHESLPAAEIIANSRVLFLDHYGTIGGIRAAKIARENGVAVVGDVERDNVPHFHELLEQIDHLIISYRFAINLTQSKSAQDALRVLVPHRAAVVVTCGEAGAWFASRENPTPQFCAAFSVKAIDTTGCGDIFHGAYAYELARGESLEHRVRFAAAAAAIKATRRGVQRAAPTRGEVEAFLQAL